MRREHLAHLTKLLTEAGSEAKTEEIKRYGSARQLLKFVGDKSSAY